MAVPKQVISITNMSVRQRTPPSNSLIIYTLQTCEKRCCGGKGTLSLRGFTTRLEYSQRQKTLPVNVVWLSCPNRNQFCQHRKQINRQLSSLMVGSKPIRWWQATSCNQMKISDIGRKLQVLKTTLHTRLTGSPAGLCRKCLQTK